MKALLITVALLAASVAQARWDLAPDQPVARRPQFLPVAHRQAALMVAQAPAGEEAHQVPVVEGVERPDSAAVDIQHGNAEAGAPAIERPAAEIAPPAEEAPDVDQPPVQQ